MKGRLGLWLRTALDSIRRRDSEKVDGRRDSEKVYGRRDGGKVNRRRDSGKVDGWREGKKLNGNHSRKAVLKFRDGTGMVRLVCEAADVSHIRSDENYVDIHYQEAGTGKVFQLRNTLNNVTSQCSRTGFVRVHRQHVVNPSRVAKFWKEGDGVMFLELDDGALIPVSRPHVREVTALLQPSCGQSCNRWPPRKWTSAVR